MDTPSAVKWVSVLKSQIWEMNLSHSIFPNAKSHSVVPPEDGNEERITLSFFGCDFFFCRLLVQSLKVFNWTELRMLVRTTHLKRINNTLKHIEVGRGVAWLLLQKVLQNDLIALPSKDTRYPLTDVLAPRDKNEDFWCLWSPGHL